VSDLVDFPINGLNVAPYLPTYKEGQDPIYYDLYAVSNHYGSLNGGHYTAYGYNSLVNKWYDFNDSSVGGVGSIDNIVSPGAYLLFYRKRE
jgi:ubiquitin carboxyl-terminal hydrolase 4/11/15